MAGAEDSRAAVIDPTDQGIMQFVREIQDYLRVLISSVRSIDDDVAHGRTDRLGQLHREAEQAALLIDALLIDDGANGPARTHVDVNGVVCVTAATLSQVERVAIRMELDLWAEPLRVRAEPGALERVLLNLLLNACDAMPTGGLLTVETAVAHLRVGAIEGVRPGPYARLTVTDTGCGMTAEAIGRSFDASFTTKANGTGLGLRSVAVTVQQLDGWISIETEPGRGTSLTVLLPLAGEPPTRSTTLS